MKKISIWSEISNKICDSLNNDIETDVLIIGGGITGISTAYHLINSNLNVCLVEKNTIASGVTSKTTGKLTYLQDNIYTKIKKYHNKYVAKKYLDSQKDAIKIVKNIIDNENIECNLEQVDSYVFTNNLESNIYKDINLLKEFNISLEETNLLPDDIKVKKSYYVHDTYVFHPIKYLNRLKDICINNGVSIYENTNIISIVKDDTFYICKTNKNNIRAKYVVVASHYPYFFKKLFMPLKSYIEKSYIEAYKVYKNYKYSSINIDKVPISTRYYSNNNTNYKIYLTNSHNTSINNNDLYNFYSVLKNNNNPDYIWSNKDIVTLDSLPFIGSLNDDNTLLIGTGYNTWGMTNGSLAGKILSDIILNRKNDYVDLFDPRRCLSKGLINFPIVLCGNAYSFIKSKVNKNKKWYSDRVRFEKRKEKMLQSILMIITRNI